MTTTAELGDRISAEVRTALDALVTERPMLTIFGSARASPGDHDYEVARELGRQLGTAGFGVITGGGPGLMEAANRGAREAGAPSFGASIVLPHEQVSNPYLDREARFDFFFTRKLALLRASCGFICFPGGFGTVDELFEALVLIQTDKLPHFPLVLVGTDYWAGLLAWIDASMTPAGAIAAHERRLLLVTDNLADVVRHCLRCHATLCAELGHGPHYPNASTRGGGATGLRRQTTQAIPGRP
ncbi:MAG: TIGR00730 family Rossman fold protein [Vicinamibacterales bacterium]